MAGGYRRGGVASCRGPEAARGDHAGLANLAAWEGDTAVAHVMWGVDEEDGSRWIGGLLVDRAHHGRGVGRKVVELLLERLRPEEAAIPTSYHPDDVASRAILVAAGFVDTDQWEGDERVTVLLS